MDKDEVCYHQYFNGDENGLRELIERYSDNLTFYINGYLHDINDSEDLMLEAFSRLLMKPRNFGQKTGSFKAYLFKIGHNLALRYMEKHRMNCYFGIDDMAREPESEELIESVLLAKERSQYLHLAMNCLNPQYRETLYLIYFEDMSYADAAQIMCKTEKQINNFAYRGRQALRSILEKDGIVCAND